MAFKPSREGAKFTRDKLDGRARGLGHDMTWVLGPNSTRVGYSYHFVGTCQCCGGTAVAYDCSSSCQGLPDARHDPCPQRV